MFNAENRRKVDNIKDRIGRFLFGIYDHGNTEIIFHAHDLFSVVRVAHSGYCVFNAQLFSNQTGKNIQLIAVCQNDSQLRIINIGFLLNFHTRTVADYSEYIVFFYQSFNFCFVFVNNGDRMTFVGKVFKYCPSNRTKADNYNFHCGVSLFFMYCICVWGKAGLLPKSDK